MRKVYICRECRKPIKEINTTTFGQYFPGYDGVEIVGAPDTGYKAIYLCTSCYSKDHFSKKFLFN